MQPPDDKELATLNPDQRRALSTLLAALSPGQTLLIARWLLARFDAAALAEDRLEAAATGDRSSQPGLTVLYGTHSGHSASIARQLANTARQQGWSVKLSDMAEYARGALRREHNLAVIVSTHGEGQPPESAAPFFEFLQGNRAPRLDRCGFAVLALGDKSYVQFCKAGEDIDAHLERLGAERLLPRVDLDVDYQDGADAWVSQALQIFSPRVTVSAAGVVEEPRPRSTRISRENPWSAELLQRVGLSGRGSNQHFIHLELSLEGSGLSYQPGDAVGVRPDNDPLLVDQLLAALRRTPDENVSVNGESYTMGEALTRRLEISKIAPSALRKYAALGASGLAPIVRDPETTAAYLNGRDWVDVLREHPIDVESSTFVALLPEIASRSYSIASSQLEHPDEVHLVVSRVDFTAHGRTRQGVASSYLADRVQAGETIPMWIEPNAQFRLPDDPTLPIVMIGAGTGIAPYRAFMQARVAAGATGKNWVIFGNQQFQKDFTYQIEWLRWRTSGALTRMDVAFSRDQAQKIYVTDRLRERARDLFDWLEQGARIYLCGDRAKLSESTDSALVDIVMSQSNRSHDHALRYVEQLRTDKRYVKDVY
jgi:sulfite reductase (NADPH) flavoprotein alpha-component